VLTVKAEHRLGDFPLAIDLRAPTRGILALFGASGAGKTSLINILAGLTRPTRGRVVVDGDVLFDSDARIDVPPERRRFGCIFQEGRLFPHLSVRSNLLYGFRRAAAGERRLDLDRIVALLGIGHLLERRPRDLSGGEKQRIAIGRALLANPRLLLMDEPLASLDGARKEEILPFIEELRDQLGLPIVYVSHDLNEIIRLADTVAIVADGRIAAVGPIEAILGRLDLRALTGFYEAGAVLRATVAAQDEAFGLTHLAFPGGTLRIARIDLPVGTEVRARIRARDVSVALSAPSDISILNVLPARIAAIGTGDGPYVDLQLALDATGAAAIWARVTARSLHDLRLAQGGSVFALIKAVAVDRQSIGRRHGGS
jgi:molybdate transport system ATP-binding protein